MPGNHDSSKIGATCHTPHTRIPTFGDRSGGAGLRGWRRWGSGCGAGWGAGAAPSPSSAPAQPSPSPPQPQPCPAPVLWPLARATAGWPGGWGPNGSQGAPRCTLEQKVRRLYYDLVPLYAAPATRTLCGPQSGKVTPKCVLSAKTRFGVPKPLISPRKT